MFRATTAFVFLGLGLSTVFATDELSLVQVKAAVAQRSRATPAESLEDGLDDDLAPNLILRDTRADRSAVGDDTYWPMNPTGSFPNDEMTAFGSPMKTGKGAIVIGFGYQKCGTTFLSSLMKPHSVYAKTKKELHYIVRHNPGLTGVGASEKEESSHCARTTTGPITFEDYMRDCFADNYPQSGQFAFDFTPDYAAPSNVDAFVKSVGGMKQSVEQHNAELRLVAVLRNPTERAISETNMKRKDGRENAKDASDADLDQKLTNHIHQAQSRWTDPEVGYPSVITFGEYNRSLSAVLSAFPKESVLLVNMAHLGEMEVWRRIHAHFGIEMPAKEVFQSSFDAQVKHTDKKQAEKYSEASADKYEPSANVETALTDYYKPFDNHLWELLGTKWW